MSVNIPKRAWSVKCGMRKSSRWPAQTSVSTLFRTVTVQAGSIEEARAEAIDECYRKFGNSIEHVNPFFGARPID